MKLILELIRRCCVRNSTEEEDTSVQTPAPVTQKESLQVMEGKSGIEFTFAKVSSSSSFNLTPAQMQDLIGHEQSQREEKKPVVLDPIFLLESEGKQKYHRKNEAESKDSGSKKSSKSKPKKSKP